MPKRTRKMSRNEIAFIGFAVVLAWVTLMLLVNSDFFRNNLVLMNIPVFIGYGIMAMMAVGYETPRSVQWFIVLVLTFSATWLTAIAVNVLFVLIYGL